MEDNCWVIGAMEKLWKSCGKAVEKLRKSYGKAVEKLWKSCGKAVEKLGKNCGKAVEKLLKSYSRQAACAYQFYGLDTRNKEAELEALKQKQLERKQDMNFRLAVDPIDPF